MKRRSSASGRGASIAYGSGMQAAAVLRRREMRLSVRLLWPFLRIIDSSPSLAMTQLLARSGIDAVTLARPDAKIPTPSRSKR